MGEQGTNESRLTRARSGRFLAVGTTGFATAVTLLMLLAPASGAIVHPSIVLTPAFKNTTNAPNAFWEVGGCGKAKTSIAHWNPATGALSAAGASSAKTCGKSQGGIGGSSYGYASDGINIAIPIKVASNGNHAISISFSVKVAAASAHTYGHCPAFNVVYPPALYQYENAYCESGSDVSVYFDAYVVDGMNSSWYSNSSYANAYNDSYTENYTDCYNYGTPTCYNFTGSNNVSSSYSYNAPGFSAFTWSAATSWSMWTNGTNMIKTHHYYLIISVSTSADSFAEFYHTLGSFSGSGSGMVNMATLGNGAKVHSVTIT